MGGSGTLTLAPSGSFETSRVGGHLRVWLLPLPLPLPLPVVRTQCERIAKGNREDAAVESSYLGCVSQTWRISRGTTLGLGLGLIRI
jgi:hypothetical protein